MSTRQELNERVLKECQEKYPDNYQAIEEFSALELMNTYNKDDCYYEALKAFKALFSLGGEARVFLWNRMYYYTSDCGAEYDMTGFSDDECTFIKSIRDSSSQLRAKYGESFSQFMNINAEIETERLILRPYNEELNQRYLDFFAENQKEFEQYYKAEYDKCIHIEQTDRPFAFAVTLKETDEFIGSVCLALIRSDCVYNIEYYIMPEFRRCGYAAEAVSALIDAAKKNELYQLHETVKEGDYEEAPLYIKCIEAKINKDNEASIRLVKNLGFRLTGEELYHIKYGDTYYNAEVYDLEL